MNLSSKTLQILRNFASIQPNFTARKGKTQITMGDAKDIVAQANLEDEFDQDFGIYDMNTFLGAIKLVDDPVITTGDKFGIISDSAGLTKIKYFFSDPDMLTKPPAGVKFENVKISFDLGIKMLKDLKSAAGALGHSGVAIVPAEKGLLELKVLGIEANSTENTFSVNAPGEYEDDVAQEYLINVSSLSRLLVLPYKVQVNSRMVKLVSADPDFDITYHLVLTERQNG